MFLAMLTPDQLGRAVLLATRVSLADGLDEDGPDLVRRAWADLPSKWRVMVRQLVADELRRGERELWSELLVWMREASRPAQDC